MVGWFDADRALGRLREAVLVVETAPPMRVRRHNRLMDVVAAECSHLAKTQDGRLALSVISPVALSTVLSYCWYRSSCSAHSVVGPMTAMSLRHFARKAADINKVIVQLVIARLSQPDAAALLTDAGDRDGALSLARSR